MKEGLYLRGHTAVINFSNAYYRNPEDLIGSDGFAEFLRSFFKNLAMTDIDVYEWTLRGRSLEEYLPELVRTLKLLMVMDLDEIPGLDHVQVIRLLSLVEKAYDYWRKLERFSIIKSSSENSIQSVNFMSSDQEFNSAVITLYRRLEEKLQGKKNLVYRQMSAGTNGSLVLANYNTRLPDLYRELRSIRFVNTVLIHTPLMLYPESNTRKGMFTEAKQNPIEYFVNRNDSWMCYPAKVGNYLVFVYFHKDFIAEAVSLANLFELADAERCIGQKPDAIVLFGNEDEKAETVFYHDTENEIWVGSLSHRSEIEYFGYMKKIILTCHNLAKMSAGWLPIHGSMFNILFKDHTQRNVVMIGDSGAGKSESLEAVKNLVGDDVLRIDVIFDDMGTFHEKDGKVVAQGTEIGAFIRLDDLDQHTAYRNIERAIFMNPTSSVNARVIQPCTTYELITTDQRIDYVLYANNYEDKIGMHRFETAKDAKEVFIRGRRMAKGTTGEKGLSETYFANPFGPMQKKEECDLIWDRIFGLLFDNDVYVGEIYTRLGLPEGRDGINIAARQLVADLRGQKDE